MLLTVTQTTAFFENPGQMAIPNATRVQIAVEGIAMVADLIDFDKDSLDQVARIFNVLVEVSIHLYLEQSHTNAC